MYMNMKRYKMKMDINVHVSISVVCQVPMGTERIGLKKRVGFSSGAETPKHSIQIKIRIQCSSL
jgi:hypothetical protein